MKFEILLKFVGPQKNVFLLAQHVLPVICSGLARRRQMVLLPLVAERRGQQNE